MMYLIKRMPFSTIKHQIEYTAKCHTFTVVDKDSCTQDFILYFRKAMR